MAFRKPFATPVKQKVKLPMLPKVNFSFQFEKMDKSERDLVEQGVVTNKESVWEILEKKRFT